jgi:hypothetical protein
MNEQTARVWDIIVKVGVCMLTTRLHRLHQRDQTTTPSIISGMKR